MIFSMSTSYFHKFSFHYFGNYLLTKPSVFLRFFDSQMSNFFLVKKEFLILHQIPTSNRLATFIIKDAYLYFFLFHVFYSQIGKIILWMIPTCVSSQNWGEKKKKKNTTPNATTTY